MGGSKPASQTTTNTPLTKQQYDPTGYKYREELLPKLASKYDLGLTDKEKSYYRGAALGDVNKAFGSGQKVLRENFARSGIGPNDGAFAESLADLLREKTVSQAGVGTDITGKDIAMKQQNLQNLLSLIADTGAVGTAGSTTTSTGPQSSTAKNAIGGLLGGGLGGLGLASSLGLGASNPAFWPVIAGGAVLGGLGGLF